MDAKHNIELTDSQASVIYVALTKLKNSNLEVTKGLIKELATPKERRHESLKDDKTLNDTVALINGTNAIIDNELIPKMIGVIKNIEKKSAPIQPPKWNSKGNSPE